MGKKKSVALIVIVSIVLAALVFISVASFGLSTPYYFAPLLSQVKLSTDLGGGYYTVYYPEGVISQEEYELLANSETEEGEENPADSYTRHKGIYLSEEIVSGDDVTDAFRSEFESAFNALCERFESKNFSGYSVKVENDYTIRVEVPYTGEDVTTLFDTFAYSGELYFSDANQNVLMEGTKEYIRSAAAVDGGSAGYAVAINFTSAGQARFAEITADLAASSSEDGTSSTASLYIYVGDEVLMQASVTEELNQRAVYISGSFQTRESAETVACVINSVLDPDNIFDLNLDASQIFTLAPTMGENAALIVAIVLGVMLAAIVLFALIRYKGMGLAHVFGLLTYALAMVLCLSLIDAVMLNAASVIAILFTVALLCGFNWYAFKNIRDEFATGKTLTASIQSGYKKSLALTIDTHIVLFAAALILFFAASGAVHYMALILMLGTAISAVCSLGLTRFYLYMFLAQPKNKIAFCNFKREETEDE